MDATKPGFESSLRCTLGWHRPQAVVHWNHGYYFTRCRRCRVDLVRTAYSRWEVPRGYRVVWSGKAPAGAIAEQAALHRTGDGLPIEEVLRHLKDDSTEAGAQTDASNEPELGFEAEPEPVEEKEDATEPLPAPTPIVSSVFPDFMDDSSTPFRAQQPPPPSADAKARSAPPGPGMTERLSKAIAPIQGMASGATASMSRAAGSLSWRVPKGVVQPLIVGGLLIAIAALVVVLINMRGLNASANGGPPPPVPSLPAPEPAFVSARLLNCREAPALEAATARRLERGDEIAVLAVDRGWASISTSEGQCWVQTRYLSLEPPL